ncbi:c-type cytochrome [Deinococcus sp. KSM4-11]|nr:c-type cytochrome [Deinococcus sp. KSM4-11]
MDHRVPRRSRWAYVFGSATLFALVLQVVTGITLAMVYTPSPAAGYESVQRLSAPGSVTAFVRALHYFGASLMVVMAGIHMIRVYLMAAYKYPREVQWLSGVVLLLLTLAMAFTGQVIRWDGNGYWSLVVGAEQAARAPVIGPWLARFLLGGDTPGVDTLPHLYALHALWLPAGLLGLVALHVGLVLRNGISEPPVPGRPVDVRTYKRDYRALVQRDGVPFWPDAAWRDAVFGSLMILLVSVLAWRLGPPLLSGPPDPSVVAVDPKPDWYLLWYFTVLALWPYGITNVMLIAAPTLGILALLALPLLRPAGERAPSRRPWALGIVGVCVAVIASLTAVGLREPWLPALDAPALPAATVHSRDPAVWRGAALWHTESCEACHRIGGLGGQRGPELSTVGARLNADQLTLRIQNGGRGMPAYAGVLSTQQLTDLVAFLHSRQ